MINESWESPQDWFLTNSYSVPSLYAYMNKLKFKFRLVHISTPEIYGNINGIISEKQKV